MSDLIRIAQDIVIANPITAHTLSLGLFDTQTAWGHLCEEDTRRSGYCLRYLNMAPFIQDASKDQTHRAFRMALAYALMRDIVEGGGVQRAAQDPLTTCAHIAIGELLAPYLPSSRVKVGQDARTKFIGTIRAYMATTTCATVCGDI